MRQLIFCGVRSYFVFLFLLLSFFLTFQNTQGSGGRSGAGRRNPGAGATQEKAGAIQKKAGTWGMASGREMVAALGLEEKKTRIEHKVTSNN